MTNAGQSLSSATSELRREIQVLCIPAPLLERAITLCLQDREHLVHARIGLSQGRDHAVWLVRNVSSAGVADSVEYTLVFALAANPAEFVATRRRALLQQGFRGIFCLAGGEQAERPFGIVRTGNGIQLFDRLDLLGPGMHSLLLSKPAEAPLAPFLPNRPDPVEGQHSRSIEAMGSENAWHRLTRLRCAVVGAGGTGSLVAVALAQLGMQHITIVDDDLVEPHSLGRMDAVGLDDIGLPKAQAVAQALRRRFNVSIAVIKGKIPNPEALAGLRRCDVIFACVDNDQARLSVSIFATLYEKLLIDIGTGIFLPQSTSQGERSRIMGADVRLVVPGDGCLLCRGGLQRYSLAVDQVSNSLPQVPAQTGAWRSERAGSLRSLNQIATGIATQFLVDLVSERLGGSIWARLDYDGDGRPAVQYPSSMVTGECHLCARLGEADGVPQWQ